MFKRLKMTRADELQTGDVHAVLGTVERIQVKDDQDGARLTGITWSTLAPHTLWFYGDETYPVR